jgi:hypothetical protein
MKTEKLVEENYLRFCQLDGSDCIASEFALSTVLQLIRTYKVKTVLEIGLGIGSISDTVLKLSNGENLNIEYFGTEANEFCNVALTQNVRSIRDIHLFKKLSEISSENKFDLIIIDGQDNQLKEIYKYCKKHSIIFIEGDRSPQRELVMSIFPKAKHVNVISLNKNKEYAHGLCETYHFVGGGQLIFTNPSFKMKFHYLKEKIRTYILRHLRKYRK